MDLPPFLQAWGNHDASVSYRNAIFKHSKPLGPVHAIWWPCKDPQSKPDTVLVFIPGNPGLNGFYTSFLSALQDQDASGELAILAHTHIGHTPGISVDNLATCYDLRAQVHSATEAFDAIKSTFGSNVKVVLAGHSVGSWIVLQVLKARNDAVSGVFLLFPTIAHIAKTPNGRRLSWLFRSSIARIISSLSAVTKLVPTSALSLMFSSWPAPQILVLRTFLHSPSAIYASLVMARDEMCTICDLDMSLLTDNKHCIWIYFAEKDDWVGEQREAILGILDAAESVKVVHGHREIPHAFCINHGEELARQCYEWLRSGNFLSSS